MSHVLNDGSEVRKHERFFVQTQKGTHGKLSPFEEVVIKMLTQREKTIMLVTFCLTFCFTLIVLTCPITAFLIISSIVKHS